MGKKRKGRYTADGRFFKRPRSSAELTRKIGKIKVPGLYDPLGLAILIDIVLSISYLLYKSTNCKTIVISMSEHVTWDNIDKNGKT